MTNSNSNKGFFHYIKNSFGINAPFIFIEFKNYVDDIANEELDQMSGRLNPKPKGPNLFTLYHQVHHACQENESKVKRGGNVNIEPMLCRSSRK
jgi:hypothetical protein